MTLLARMMRLMMMKSHFLKRFASLGALKYFQKCERLLLFLVQLGGMFFFTTTNN